MSKKFTVYFMLIVCILLSAGVQAAAADGITVALHPDSKPFLYISDNNEIVGIDREVINAVAGTQGLDVKFVLMNFDEMIDAAASCKVDAAISSMTRTEEREEIALFSEPYFIASKVLFIKNNRTDIESIESEGIKTIGVKGNSTSETTVIEYQGENNYEIRTFDEYPEMFKALENGEIDAAVTDDTLGKLFVDEYSDIVTVGAPISEEPYAIAVCPENPELLETINAGLDEIRNNGMLDLIILDNMK